MKFGSLIKSMLVSAALWASADTAMALKCDYTVPAVTGVMPLQVSSITVGRDVPLGTEVYRQSFDVTPANFPKLYCTYSSTFQMTTVYDVGSFSSKANWFQGPYANKVYKTNLEGLGAVIVGDTATVPWSASMWVHENNKCPRSGACDLHYGDVVKFDLILIKIGDVKPGRLSDFPTVIMKLDINSLSFRGLLINMEGGIDVVSRTCSTPDVWVPMGEHQTKAFTGINSSSGWKAFSIALNNCPAFHGTYSKSPPRWLSTGGYYTGGSGTRGTKDDNRLQFRIDPARSAYDASNGVLSLDPSIPGTPPAASGIGIQIAPPGGTRVPFGVNQNSGLTLRASEGSYSIPLRARYIQTGSRVTPGPANASAMFTIIYQ